METKLKPAYKGDETLETGKKILAKLKSLGGKNYIGYGCYYGGYYFIDDHNRIDLKDTLPQGYYFASLEEEIKEQLPIPRMVMTSKGERMLIADLGEKSKGRYILVIPEDLQKYLNSEKYDWFYTNEITELPQVEQEETETHTIIKVPKGVEFEFKVK